MKEISLIQRMRATYRKLVIGEQALLIDTPFFIKAGHLDIEGDVHNYAPPYHIEQVTGFNLLAITANQQVLAYKNNHYRKLFVIHQAALATVSVDVRVSAHYPGFTLNVLTDGDGGTLYQQNALASSGAWPRLCSTTKGDGIPYGGDISIEFTMDNNHATDDITINAAMLFFDPVR